MDNTLEKLNVYLKEVEGMAEYNTRNGTRLKSLSKQLYKTIESMPKEHDGQYSDLLMGLIESSTRYNLGVKKSDSFYIAKDNFLLDIKNTIERYTEDNNLSA